MELLAHAEKHLKGLLLVGLLFFVIERVMGARRRPGFFRPGMLTDAAYFFTIELFKQTGKVWFTADEGQIQKLRDVVFMLPFHSMAHTPTSIFLERDVPVAGLLAEQAAWAAVLWLGGVIGWRHAQRVLTVQGG